MPNVRHPSTEQVRQAAESDPPPEHAATAPAWLTEQAIRDWTSDTALQRGRPYSYDAVFHTVRASSTLKASCQGTQPTPYHIAVTLGQDQISQASCTCPVGESGRCKHVAAVLLTYRARPDEFIEVEPLEQALERRSKAELAALIRRMVERYPDLERMLTLPVSSGSTAISPALIERQAQNAFRFSSEWNAAPAIVSELDQIIDTGNQHAQAGDHRSAATIYSAVVRVTLERLHEVDDEEATLLSVIHDCIEGLDACLQHESDATQRETLLRALFDIYHWEAQHGDDGVADPVPDILLAQASPEERHLLADWVRATMPRGHDLGARMDRQGYYAFLLDLEFDQLDDAAFLDIAREAGLIRQLIGRLLELGRADEALSEASHLDASQLLPLTDLFARHGLDGQFEQVVRRRSAISPDDGALLEWLKQRAIARSDPSETIDLTEQLFWQRPSFSSYSDLQRLARQHDVWEEHQPTILARLEQLQNYGLLTEIHIAEGAIAQALETLRHVRNWWPYGSPGLNIQLAEAAEASHPHDAIRLYSEAARTLIGQQGRQNYAIAAEYLGRVRGLYQKLDQETTWSDLINEIRSSHKRLRALREELDKAKL